MKTTTFQRTTHLYKRVFHYILPFWPMLLLGVLANMAYAGIDAGFTYMLKPFMNRGFIDKDMDFIQWVPLIIVVGIGLRGMVHAGGSYCMTWVARHVIKVFRQRVFAHMVHLPARYYDQSSSGQLLSKLLYDVEQIAHVSADTLTTFVQSVCLVIGLLSVMFIISWQLSLLFLITVPFVAVIVKYSNRRIRRVSRSVQESMGEVTHIAEEVIEGYRVVRIFGGETYEVNKFNQATELSRRRDMKVAVTQAYNVFGVELVVAIGISAIVYAVIHLSTVIPTTAGSFLAIIAAMLLLIKPMKNLTTMNSIIQRGLAGAESIFNLLDEPLEKERGQQVLQNVKGSISYQGVNFAYGAEEKLVLQNIDFTVEPGQTIALVGRSGSGKSTLVNLLPRFYEGFTGKIMIDGCDIQTLSLHSLRQQISLVSQQTTLFNDTIANNIAYGMLGNVDRYAIEQAAKAACAMEFIAALPQGLDTLIGENGVLLSGGQRQRLAIARAILKDAPILILDEATSALDTESERYVQTALDAVMKNRTTLVIAHRLSTIENADHILVMDAGKIVERGSHQNLLQQNGYYAKLYHMQFTEQRKSYELDLV